jgi:superoxide reductase
MAEVTEIRRGLFCKINRAEGNNDSLALKHAPVFCIPDKVKAGEPFQVSLTIGEKPYENEKEHHIQWLELYAGEIFLGRVDFTPEMTYPEFTFTIRLAHEMEATLRAISRCNLHGLWESSKKIQVIY